MDLTGLNIVHKQEILQTRAISTLPELKDVYAYRIRYFMNNNILDEKQGLATSDVLKVYLETGKWQGDFYGNLVRVNSLNDILKDPREEFKIKDIVILNPYECGEVIDEKKLFTIIKPVPEDITIYDYLGDYHSMGIFMDYRVGIDDWHYDLDEFLEVIKGRDDIIFDRFIPVVEDIHYFNITSKRKKTISFWWTPSEEDYHKVFESKSTTPVSLVPELIFGIKPKNEL